MRKILTLLTFPLLFLTSCEKETAISSEPESTPTPNLSLFEGRIGTGDNSTILSLDNQLLICGNIGAEITLIKASKSGGEIWQKEYYLGNTNSVSSITQTVSGDIFLCGSTDRHFSESKQDILILKMDANGDTIWTKTYGGLETEYGINIITTSDQNILITSKVEGLEPGISGEVFIMKINFDGDILWTKLIEKHGDQYPRSLIETSDHGYLITGVGWENDSRGITLMKLNAMGDVLWEHTLEETVVFSKGNATIELCSGDLLTVVRSTKWDGGSGYAYLTILKTTSTGIPIWHKEFGEKAWKETGYSIKESENGNFIISGSNYDREMRSEIITTSSFDQAGNQIWRKTYKGSEIECSGKSWGANLIKDSSDDNIITGDFEGNIFVFRIDNQGNYQ